MKSFYRIATAAAIYVISNPAFADMHGAAAHHGGSNLKFLGLMSLGAALGIGLAAAGAAFGQGRAASAALDGIARNPSAAGPMQVPLILSLALMESLVILAFLVNNSIAGSIASTLKAEFASGGQQAVKLKAFGMEE